MPVPGPWMTSIGCWLGGMRSWPKSIRGHAFCAWAQALVGLLGSLPQHMGVWARGWMTSAQIARFGILRMVRDVFRISGLLRFDPCIHIVETVLDQDARLARSLIRSLRELLTPFNIVVNLGET